MSTTIKGIHASEQKLDGDHLLKKIEKLARWNMAVIGKLLDGAKNRLIELGVKPANIVTENVSGSFELPMSCSRLIAASQVQASANATDLMGATSLLDRPATPAGGAASSPKTSAFDAVIAIGVLIKGSTMHFEYIADAVSHGLMRVGLDTGVPVIFGVLTCLTDEQALERAGVDIGDKKGHNHGVDWAEAAIEQSLNCKRWAQGGI